MTEAELAASCIDNVSGYLVREFKLKEWEARPIAADVVILVLQELRTTRKSDND